MEYTLKILVVDDEEGMRLGTSRALSRYVARFEEIPAEVTYAVDLASSGEEALEKIAAAAPDIVLLDYKLPGMSGLDVLAKVRGMGVDTVTIIMTAYASLETAIVATKQGAFDFLAKPFNPQEVRASVRKATSQLLLLRAAQRLADEKRKIRFEFITVLSHELKAPLNAVESYLALMQSSLDAFDPATFGRSIERSLVRVHGMRKLILDLIDATRLESGTVARHLEEHDLAAVAQAAVEAHEALAHDRKISLSCDTAGDVRLLADRAELDIVFNNLVSNAIKYNRDGGAVRIRLRRDGPTRFIEVEDTGIGLSPGDIERLFSDFVRIKNDKTKNIEGSGLGLSTLKKVAALYGGTVGVTSTPDVGSTFTVTLKDEREIVAQPRLRSSVPPSAVTR